MPTSNEITLSKPRTHIRITLADNTVLEGPVGTTIEGFLREAEKEGLISFSGWLVAAICNGKLRELSYELTSDAQIQTVYLRDVDGYRIYRRSLTFLLVTATAKLFPKAKVSINYALTQGGYFCEVGGRGNFTVEELTSIEAEMKAIVKRNEPITKTVVPLKEAQKMFEERGDEDKSRVLEIRDRETLTLYNLCGYAEYYYGYMVSSAGYMDTFKLIHVDEGFILQHPTRESPRKLDEIEVYNRMSTIFTQSNDWLEKMELEDMGQLNRLVEKDQITELILIAEALHQQDIASIANEICRRTDAGVRIVLIAGPTSSGKTTFSKRLAIQLLAQGIRPFTLEMDNYFVDREKTPKNAKGEYDFESIKAVDVELFNEHLLALMEGKHVQLPRFDFVSGKRVVGAEAQLQKNEIIIIEGIHGLNPELVQNIPSDKLFRIYAAVMTQLNIDKHNRIPTSDVRLLRRIVRDAYNRGHNASRTLKMWENVRVGERQNIFPYQDYANVMFNSALPYELSALKLLAEPLLLQVEPNTPQHIEANRLLSFLNWVRPMNADQRSQIPDTSLLREFIGGSILKHYHPGKLGNND